MCGIAGFLGKGSEEILKSMSQKLYHRGPDENGSYIDLNKKIFLTHTRLSIQDIHFGKQPMWDFSNRVCIVFNGEIYNHIEIRNNLKYKYQFKTSHSDTEIILNSYLEWGSNCVSRFNGMWAFVIYDKEKDIIFASRDRIGKKPFFYTFQKNTFAFASELTALKVHSDLDFSISTISIQKYFAYNYIPAPLSIYKNVYKLEAGENLIYHISNQSIKKDKFWIFSIEPEIEYSREKELEVIEKISEILESSVRRRLISDVPLGVFLSGGLDSSLVAYYASQNRPKGELLSISVGFNEKSFDESYYARLMSRYIGSRHVEQNLTEENLKEVLEKSLEKMDEPIGDSSILPTFLLCELARRNATVYLSGDGGDEIFAGYDPMKAIKAVEVYTKIIPKNTHEGIKKFFEYLPTSHQNMSLDFKIKKTLQGISYPQSIRNAVWLGSLEPSEIEELTSQKLILEDLYSECIQIWDNAKSKNSIDRSIEFFTRLYLQNGILVKADRASMMNSIEVRSPFLDIELVEYSRKLSHKFKIQNGNTKYILKKTAEKVLPKEIVYRSKKGFGVPIGKWFWSGKLKINNNLNFLNNSFINMKFLEHKIKKKDNRLFLWNIKALEMYLKY
jgi:asparagine synthase (glutamine-hydrolysing)